MPVASCCFGALFYTRWLGNFRGTHSLILTNLTVTGLPSRPLPVCPTANFIIPTTILLQWDPPPWLYLQLQCWAGTFCCDIRWQQIQVCYTHCQLWSFKQPSVFIDSEDRSVRRKYLALTKELFLGTHISDLLTYLDIPIPILWVCWLHALDDFLFCILKRSKGWDLGVKAFCVALALLMTLHFSEPAVHFRTVSPLLPQLF